MADWVVTEKIHGANFCFIIDATTGQAATRFLRFFKKNKKFAVLHAKRREILHDDDEFFGFHSVAQRLDPAMQILFANARAQHANVERVLVYGELFGGVYPHEAVEAEHEAEAAVTPVQSEIFYSPRVDFCAFDVALQQSGATSLQWLDCLAAAELLAEARVPWSKYALPGAAEFGVAWRVALFSHKTRSNRIFAGRWLCVRLTPRLRFRSSLPARCHQSSVCRH